jgi:hypothetical protein
MARAVNLVVKAVWDLRDPREIGDRLALLALQVQRDEMVQQALQVQRARRDQQVLQARLVLQVRLEPLALRDLQDHPDRNQAV